MWASVTIIGEYVCTMIYRVVRVVVPEVSVYLVNLLECLQTEKLVNFLHTIVISEQKSQLSGTWTPHMKRSNLDRTQHPYR